MGQILLDGDSRLWGIIPTTRQRLPFDACWPTWYDHSFPQTTERVHSDWAGV
ncbi:MAG: hypothetical protein M3008_10500 [Chloroflexota bacterium]|nr:hypothetical protein [Chloroflexota bacterium]